MASKQELYIGFLEDEGYKPETSEQGDVRFKHQGEMYVLSAAEDDPNYFKVTYYHSWDPEQTAQLLPLLNVINARFKVVKACVIENLLVLTTETFVKEPEDFSSVFTRCFNMITVAKAQLAAALSGSNPKA